MSVMRTFVGYYKKTGERVVKVCSPTGLFEAFFTEHGEGPHSGVQVAKSEIVSKLPAEFKSNKASEQDIEKMKDVVEVMREANDKLYE